MMNASGLDPDEIENLLAQVQALRQPEAQAPAFAGTQASGGQQTNEKIRIKTSAPVAVPVTEPKPGGEPAAVLTDEAQPVKSVSSYSGGFKKPEDAIPFSPDILEYLNTGALPRFDARKRELEDKYESGRFGAHAMNALEGFSQGLAMAAGGSYKPKDYVGELKADTLGRIDPERLREQEDLLARAGLISKQNQSKWDADKFALSLEEQARRERADLDRQKVANRKLELELMKIMGQRDAETGRNTRQGNNLRAAYQDDLLRANIPQFRVAFNELRSALPASDSIPGWKSGQVQPGVVLSPEQNRVKSAVAALKNQRLYDRSGAAVTQNELDRLDTELSSGIWDSPKNLRHRLAVIEKEFNDVALGISQGYPDDVVRAYHSSEGKRRGDSGMAFTSDSSLPPIERKPPPVAGFKGAKLGPGEKIIRNSKTGEQAIFNPATGEMRPLK